MIARRARVRSTAVTLMCLAGVVATGLPAVAAGSTLRAGQSVVGGEEPALGSANGEFHLYVAQVGHPETAITTGDGQCVDYLYSKRSEQTDENETLVMQADGNLVQYHPDGSVGLASGTHGHPGAYATLHDDGALRVHAASGSVLWSAGAACSEVIGTAMPGEYSPQFHLESGWQLNDPSRRHTLLMQRDGNLVLRNASGQPLWHSGTHGNPGAFAVVQADGNFVIYSGSGRPLWQSRTAGIPRTSDARLVVQDDGNVVLYELKPDGRTRRAMWSSGTAGR